jgi:hypothetical protein
VPVGDRSFRGSNTVEAAFVDDKWGVRPNLTLNLGLRRERESITPDSNNLAPRLGLAWNPKGHDNLLLRASFGIYYGQALFQFYELAFVYGRDGVEVFDVRDNFPRNPNPDVIDPDRELPSIETASVGGQLAFGDVLVKADYVYSRGLHLWRSRDINPFNPQTGSRPDPLFGRIRQFETTASSRYHALQTSLTKRLSHGYQLQVAYTLSDTENDADNAFSLPNDEFDPSADEGSATSDRTHVLAVNGQVVGTTLPSNFGEPQAALEGRILQLGVRFND